MGGNGLYVQNCKFVHTGRGRFSSPPAAGVDIEAEYVGIKNGVFENCEFADNAGCGLVANTGNSSDCSFTGCTFWGTTTWSVWVTKPRFTFNNCNMYGSVTQGYSADNATDATSFNNCNFEDKLYGGQPTYGNYLVESNNVKRMSFTGCNFTSNTKKLCYLSAPASYSAQEKYQLNNCNFIINNDNLPANDFVGILAGAVATNCTFNFTSADAKAKRYNFGSVNPLTNPAFSGNTVLYQGR